MSEIETLEQIQPFGSAAVALLPSLVFTLVAGVCWFFLCRRIKRRDDQQWDTAVSTASVGRSGVRPSDRLFLRTIAGSGAVALLYVSAMLAGILSASPQEREFIQMVREGDLATSPRVQVAIRVADDAVYVSRRNFQAVAAAIDQR